MVSVSGFTLHDQVAAIKSLINRPSYSLSDMQIRMIAEAFQNCADTRKISIKNTSQEQVLPKTNALTPKKPFTTGQ